jgi:hypothetical protein
MSSGTGQRADKPADIIHAPDATGATRMASARSAGSLAGRRVRLLCAWSGPAFLLLFFVGFLIAGLVPPPSAARGAAEIASFYRENTDQLRIGSLIAMVATPLMVPFLLLLTQEMKRSNRQLGLLADTQLICGVVFMVLIYLPVTLIALAAFRPERPAESTQLINDAAFFILFWTISVPTLEYVALGLAVLMDRGPQPLFPRWVGWFNLAVGVIFGFGAVGLFVKDGPFAWNGLLAFWGILGSFGVWIAVTFAYLLRAINRSVAPE